MCAIFRPLHIAVAQGEVDVVHKLIFIMETARKNLNIYNHLRQVRQRLSSGLFGLAQRGPSMQPLKILTDANLRLVEHLKLIG